MSFYREGGCEFRLTTADPAALRAGQLVCVARDTALLVTALLFTGRKRLARARGFRPSGMRRTSCTNQWAFRRLPAGKGRMPRRETGRENSHSRPCYSSKRSRSPGSILSSWFLSPIETDSVFLQFTTKQLYNTFCDVQTQPVYFSQNLFFISSTAHV